jgi:hypothetical protein
MSILTVPAETASQLSALTETTAICSPDGKVLGVFTPQPAGADGVWTRADLEEAEQALAEERDAARPLEEIWRELRSRERSA